MDQQASSLANVLVIMPALNEEATIEGVIQELQAVGLSRIRVVDNGSRDRTPQIASNAGAEVIAEPMKGYGQACWRGMQEIEPTIDWILFCDADGSDDLSQLPELLAKRSDYDFILGNRRGTAEGRANLTPVQNFGNWLASSLIYWGWGYRYHDLGPLRLIRREALEPIGMHDRGFGWTVEMQARAVECELRICELPVNYRPRQGGESKISGTLSGSVKAGTIILTTWAKLYGQTLFGESGRAGEGQNSEFKIQNSKLVTKNVGLCPSRRVEPRIKDQEQIQNPKSQIQNPSSPSPLSSPSSSPPSPPTHPPSYPPTLLLFSSTFLLIFGSVWSIPHGDFGDPAAVVQFWWGMGFMGVGFMLSWRLPSEGAGWFWGVAIATRILLLGMHPNSDMWRYLWEGAIQLQGFSPYELAPTADVLVPLRTDWWGDINNIDTSAIYPPITQFGFRLLASLQPSVLLFKSAFTVADLGICWLLSRRFGYLATLLYAWNPLVIYSFAGGGHYDSWFLLPLVAAWFWFERPYARSLTDSPAFHWLGSAFFVGLSIAVKWISLPILSFLAWRSLRSGKWLVTAGVLLLGSLPMVLSALPFCGLQACPLVPTGSAFVNYGRSAEFVPHIVAYFWEASRQSNQLYALPLALLVVVLLLFVGRFKTFAESYLIGLLLLSPIVHAWYFTWLIPFSVASRNLGIRLVSLSAFVYFALPYHLVRGDSQWYLMEWERWLLWLPFVLGLLWVSIAQKFLRQGSASLRLM